MTQQVIFKSENIHRSLDRISLEILERNHGREDLALIGIHTGGVYLAERIRSRIKKHEKEEVELGTLDITLYRDDWSLISQNPIVRKTDISFLVEDKKIVLVDDVIFTGRTIRAAMDAIMDYGRPRSIELAVLVDRGGRELPIQPDYIGMSVSVGPNQRVDVLLHEKDNIDEIVIKER